MTMERKRWLRMAALTVIGGGMVAGGWYRFVWATPADAGATEPPLQRVTTAAPKGSPTASRAGASIERLHQPELVSPVVPAGGISPPADQGTSAIPVIPVVPIGATPIPAPSVPPLPVPAVPVVTPASGPRPTEAAFPPIDKGLLPAMPATPPLAMPGGATESKPSHVAPPGLPDLPPLPGVTPEPPKTTPAGPSVPVAPALPQTPDLAPSIPPSKTTDLVQPMLPAKPDSGLNVPLPGNTLNPTVPALPPITPPDAIGGKTLSTPEARSKPTEPKPGASDKFVFPVPAVPNPHDSHPRDDAMHKLTATAAFAVLSGALLGAEKANAAFPTIPAPSTITVPGALVKADEKTDEKTDLTKLKKELADANTKIETLQKQVTTLTELIKGKKDSTGAVLPSDPGAVAEIKELKNKIAALQKELTTIKKTQTSLKPSVGAPATKPTGTVKIINEYPVEISIVVNDKSHRVAPSKVLDIEVPAGEFSYQLLTAGAQMTKSTIQKGETVRLRIR